MLTFRVYPKRRASQGVGDYFVVRIYANKCLMQKAIRKDRRIGSTNTLGLCSWYTLLHRVRGRWVQQRECGTIYLCRGYCGAGIVAHELTHAAFAWLWKRQQWRPRWGRGTIGLEEPLAWTVGWLVAQFWTEWFRLKEKK